ncbi:hypothetical protein LINGRAHAP2_LOCUS3197 [Linum grandiflorum]
MPDADTDVAGRVPARDIVVIDDDDEDDAADVDRNEIRKKGKRGRKTAKKYKRVNTNNNVDYNAAFEQVPLLNNLKNYMSSMLDDMKETRDDMLKLLKVEVKKMVAEEFKLLRKQCSCFHQKVVPQATERTATKNKRPADTCNTSNLRTTGDHNRNKHSSMAIVPVDSSPSAGQDQVQEKQRPEIVLGIKADQSVMRCKRGKRVAESEDQSGGRRLGFGLGLGFGFQPGSLGLGYNNSPAKYSTLSTSFNNVQGRVLQGSSGGGSYNMGYFQRLMQTDEISSGGSGSRALMGSYLRENRLASSSAASSGRSGFQSGVLQQNVAADGTMNSQFPAGLRISGGGLRFSSGSNSMMQIPNNNFHPGSYRSDHQGRSMAFPDGFQFHK